MPSPSHEVSIASDRQENTGKESAARQSESSFPQFTSLPYEIRRHIWRLCLPHRLVSFLDYDPYYKCDLTEMTRRRLPPFISRVCSEARGVALEFGGLRHLNRDIVDEIVWFDTSTDTLLLEFVPYNGETDKESGDLLLESRGASLLELKDVKNILISESAFHSNPGWMVSLIVSRNLPYSIVLDTPVITHLTQTEAKESSLLGSWAEENTVVFDVRDLGKIKKLQAYHKPPAYVQEGDGGKDFFHSICSSLDEEGHRPEEDLLENEQFDIERSWQKGLERSPHLGPQASPSAKFNLLVMFRNCSQQGHLRRDWCD